MSSRFERHFEGVEILDGLLSSVGSHLDSNEVLARFVAGHQAGEPSSEIIPTLFHEEPQFQDPELARRLYQNLLGLWDLVASGRKVEVAPTRPPRERRSRPLPPPPFEGEPDAAFVEAAWRYLEALPEGDPRGYERLTHAFENRQDALLQWVDEQGLSDEKYEALRYLLFELSAMLELGWPSGLSSVHPDALEAAPENGADLPAALRAWVTESLAESDVDEDARLEGLALRGLHALWAARGSRGT